MTPRSAVMVASCVLSVAIGLVIARGRGESDGATTTAHKPLIGLSMDTLKEARWQGDRDMFVSAANRLGADVLVQSANSDDARQIADVEALLSRKVDALVIVPHDGAAMAKAVRMAHDAGVPVIAYDRIIRDADLDLYLSFDNFKVGELQARFLVDKLHASGRKRIVRIYGARTDNNAFQLKAGQDRALEPAIKSGDIEVVHEDWAEDWKPENGKKIVNAAITAKGRKLDGVLASNDGTAGGAIQALTEEGLNDVVVTGQDAELVACQRVLAGTQAMTIYKPLRVLAERAAETAVALARHKPVVARQSVPNGKIDVPSILAEVVTVTRENLDATVIKDGFLKRQDVYRDAAPGK